MVAEYSIVHHQMIIFRASPLASRVVQAVVGAVTIGAQHLSDFCRIKDNKKAPGHVTLSIRLTCPGTTY